LAVLRSITWSRRVTGRPTIRELERLLGKKQMEIEILQAA
jgi:hypothetical protein